MIFVLFLKTNYLNDFYDDFAKFSSILSITVIAHTGTREPGAKMALTPTLYKNS
jgi:hypothetical protein